MNSSVQCQKKINGCFCDSVYVKNAVHTDLIVPRTEGGTVSIPSLVPVIECLTLTDTKTVVGCDASNGTGNQNTSVGNRAGRSLTTGFQNTLIGSFAGDNLTTGTRNSINGFASGLSLTIGSNNVLIGSGTGNSLTTGFNNVIIGQAAGGLISATVSGCVLVGNDAGFNNSVSNRLMIDNSNTNEPLLDGDFANDTLQVNGKVTLGKTSVNTTHDIRSEVEEIAGLINTDDKCFKIEISGVAYYVKLWDPP